ncbi:hypothetical protein [Flavobacterium sp.]|jgi:hypothetical protein|uniref:hypothetical protein n=1 Tax=Flavobacterium sp. TaxID=239 RepID=UPI0037C14815
MHFLKRFLDFYIYSSIHVGFAVMALVYVTTFSYDLSKTILYPSCVFFGTVLGYNFLKYFFVLRIGNFYSKKYYNILVISLLALIGFLCFFLCLKQRIQIHLLFSGIAVLVYPYLRKYGWLKLFLVSFVVTYITVFIPYQSVKGLPLDFYVNLLQRFIIITSLLIPFEIMDSKTDAITMNTLPQLFGINKTKVLGILLVIPFIVLEFLKQKADYLVIPIGLLTILFITFTTLERNKYYTTFWVESVPILWLSLLLCFS